MIRLTMTVTMKSAHSCQRSKTRTTNLVSGRSWKTVLAKIYRGSVCQSTSMSRLVWCRR